MGSCETVMMIQILGFEQPKLSSAEISCLDPTISPKAIYFCRMLCFSLAKEFTAHQQGFCSLEQID
jgi:hypothetical protein